MARNPVLHAKTKHIECHHHFVQKKLITKEIDVMHIPSFQQEDILMKP
jgi:hypothetical protein